MRMTESVKSALEEAVWAAMGSGIEEESGACGSCGSYHPKDFFGDCRDDRYRYHPDDLLLVLFAAPDLLEAAKDLVRHLEKMEGGKWLNNAPGQELKAAIAKAEGKEVLK